MTKHIAQEYQVLDEISHIRKRTGMYAGSTSLQTGKEWIYDQASKKMVKKEISYIPAFVKIFSEILDNAIDEGRRAPGVMDAIKVEISEDGILSVQDNGRGIPVEIHPQTKTYVATTVFSNLRAGSNFNDEEDQQIIGTNGVGSTLTNVLSTSFKIESCDGKKLLKQEFFNGMRESTEPKIKPHDKNYTKITFRPDYEFFNLKGLDEDHKLRLIKKVVDAAATNTKIKFYVNGERVMLKSFDDYVALYADEYVFDDTTDWKVAVSASDGFEQISFVNSVETYQGGMHVDYVTRQIVDGLRTHIEKKAKVSVSPGDIRGHLRVYISANVNRPKFSSQTKENLISTPSEWKTTWSCPDKFIQKLLKTSIIQSVLDWVEAKKLAEDMKALKSANKDLNKVDPRKVDKFTDASERHQRIKTVLFLSEGDSAAKSIAGARGNNPYIGSFPLRGKPQNVREKDIIRILGLDREKKGKDGKVEPNEIQKILTIIGLKIGTPVRSLDELRFGKVALASDADTDGFHICGLLINLFDRFWPELFKMGFVHILRTPVVMVTLKDKSTLEFFTERAYKKWEANAGAKLKGSTMKYYKGLASWSTKQFANFLESLDTYLYRVDSIDQEDLEAIDLSFNSQRADDRKNWLETPAGEFDDHIQT
jgi:DNA topoisomerase-2